MGAGERSVRVGAGASSPGWSAPPPPMTARSGRLGVRRLRPAGGKEQDSNKLPVWRGPLVVWKLAKHITTFRGFVKQILLLIVGLAVLVGVLSVPAYFVLKAVAGIDLLRLAGIAVTDPQRVINFMMRMTTQRSRRAASSSGPRSPVSPSRRSSRPSS